MICELISVGVFSLLHELSNIILLFIAHVLSFFFRQLDSFEDEFFEVSLKLFGVVVSYLQLRKHLSPLELVDLVREVVGSSISLNGQLELCFYFFIDGDLQGHITDGRLLGESTLDFSDPETLVILFYKGLDLLDSQDDVVDLEKDTLSSNHVANFELNILFVFKKLGYSVLVGLFFTVESLLDTPFDLLFSFSLCLFKKHLFLDSKHGFIVGAVRV